MAKKLLMKTRVVEARDETGRIRSFTLTHASRPQLPAFEAGAHVTVLLPNGMRRPYSICSDPDDLASYRLGVLREEPGLGGSRAMHEVRSGDTLLVTHPADEFRLPDGDGFVLLIAGGIGITPILSMLYRLRRDDRPFRLHYCVRSEQDAAFLDEVRALSGSDRFALHVSAGADACRLDVDAAIGSRTDGAHIVCCGPTRLVDAVLATADRNGWPEQSVHVERFSAMPVEERARGEAFEIEVASTGQILAVSDNRSALDVLREAGFEIESSCEGGVCGTCRVRWLAGEPVHRDLALRVGERADTMLACVSRAKGRLRVDL